MRLEGSNQVTTAGPSIERLNVCTGSGELFGLLASADGSRTYEQRCRLHDCGCRLESWHQPRSEMPQPPGDFPTALELCYCCASNIIPSGSKFSIFFCDACRPDIVRLRDAVGSAVIPLGRHSLMNGIALRGPNARSRLHVTSFAAANIQSANRMDRLFEWRRLVIADRVTSMHANAAFVGAPEYLVFATGLVLPPQEMFRQLCRFLNVEL